MNHKTTMPKAFLNSTFKIHNSKLSLFTQNKANFLRNDDPVSLYNKMIYCKNCHFGNWVCFPKQTQFWERGRP
jgi:hypothetical protein